MSAEDYLVAALVSSGIGTMSLLTDQRKRLSELKAQRPSDLALQGLYEIACYLDQKDIDELFGPQAQGVHEALVWIFETARKKRA